jgi:OmpA-OmpF porin, OOP family
MKKFKYTMLGTVAVLGLTANIAMANDSNFIPHYSVYGADYMRLLNAEQNTQLTNYLEYEEREPCQNYRMPPTGFYKDGCKLMYIYPERQQETAAADQQAPAPAVKREVLATYTINFGFDSSSIESAANSVLDLISNEIKQYNPSDVTVAGYTDRSGSTEYNMALSERRADAISRELTQRGIEHQIINEETYGETDSAVETNDGIKLRENRRVVIDFLK